MKGQKAKPGKIEQDKPRDPGAGDGNQGEGNRAADRRYREKASEFARSPRAREAADEARRALDEGELEPDEVDTGRIDHRDNLEGVEREHPSGAARERR